MRSRLQCSITRTHHLVEDLVSAPAAHPCPSRGASRRRGSGPRGPAGIRWRSHLARTSVLPARRGPALARASASARDARRTTFVSDFLLKDANSSRTEAGVPYRRGRRAPSDPGGYRCQDSSPASCPAVVTHLNLSRVEEEAPRARSRDGGRREGVARGGSNERGLRLGRPVSGSWIASCRVSPPVRRRCIALANVGDRLSEGHILRLNSSPPPRSRADDSVTARPCPYQDDRQRSLIPAFPVSSDSSNASPVSQS